MTLCVVVIGLVYDCCSDQVSDRAQHHSHRHSIDDPSHEALGRKLSEHGVDLAWDGTVRGSLGYNWRYRYYDKITSCCSSFLYVAVKHLHSRDC